MKKTLKRFLLISGLIFLLIAILIFRPVPIVSEDEAITKIGVVKDIYSNQGNDIVFTIENNKRRYYINRGLELGLHLEDLKQELIGKEITIKYPKYWTPLDWNNQIRHLSKLEFRDKVLFNELKD